MSRRYPNTKLGKTRFLLDHGVYKSFIPETKVMSRSNLQQMLGKYGMVYVKPDKGTGGFGVMRVKREKAGNHFRYGYHLGNQTRTFPAYEALFQSMSRKMGKRTHLVQKGIEMLKVRGRPFDIRIMVQKNEKGKWEQTGMIGRLAHPQKAVTNFHSGGTPLPVDNLLKPHLGKSGRRQMIRKLKDLGLGITASMEKGYPYLKEAGVDVGLDQDITPWIFEVNTRPDPFIFRRLRNKSVFYRVFRLSKLHGRFRARKP